MARLRRVSEFRANRRISRNKKGPGNGPWVERRRGKSGQTRPISGARHTIRMLRKALAPDFGGRTVVAAPFPVKQPIGSAAARLTFPQKHSRRAAPKA